MDDITGVCLCGLSFRRTNVGLLLGLIARLCADIGRAMGNKINKGAEFQPLNHKFWFNGGLETTAIL